MMMKLGPIVSVFVFALPAHAGLYTTLDSTNTLPAKWRGYLPDQRAMRLIAVDTSRIPNAAPSPWRERMLDRVLTLEGRVRSADDAVNLTYALIRLGRYEQALGVLRAARRQHPDDFRLAAHAGTAHQLAGDFDAALDALREAVRLAPADRKDAEALHLKLVTSRKAKPVKTIDAPDDLFDLKNLTAAQLAALQQLGLWLPADGRLLWLLGEAAIATGDLRTGANILDGCAGEFAMGSTVLRERRQAVRKQIEALEAKEEHSSANGRLAFASTRPLGSAYDATKMPAVRADRPNPLPWEAVAETTVGKGFTPKFVKYVDELDGKPVTITGSAAKSGDDADGLALLLTEFPIGCWFCESPEPVSIIRVEFANAVDLATVGKGIIKIRGTLKLNRTDPERFLFSIKDATVSGVD